MNWWKKLAFGDIYGYWIKPSGQLISVYDEAGHLEALFEQPEFGTPPSNLNTYQITEQWYAKAFAAGWCRVITDDPEFDVEIKVQPTESMIYAIYRALVQGGANIASRISVENGSHSTNIQLRMLRDTLSNITNMPEGVQNG